MTGQPDESHADQLVRLIRAEIHRVLPVVRWINDWRPWQIACAYVLVSLLFVFATVWMVTHP